MSNKLNFFNLTIEAFKEWIRDKSSGMAASIAYFQILSLGSCIGFIIHFSHRCLGETTTHEEIIPLLKNWFTPQFVKVIIFMMGKIDGTSNTEIYSYSIIIGLLFFIGTKEFFAQLRDAVEMTWNRRRDVFGVKYTFIRLRDDYFGAVVTIFLIIVILFLRTLFPIPEEDSFLDKNILGHMIDMILELCLLIILFFFILYIFPPVKVYWKHAIPGAVFTAALIVIARIIMKFYMYKWTQMDVTESLITVLIWFYISNQLFIFGAEFSKVYISRKQNIDVKSIEMEG